MIMKGCHAKGMLNAAGDLDDGALRTSQWVKSKVLTEVRGKAPKNL